MKKIILYILIASFLFLCSCGGGFYDAVCSVLGIDNSDYAAEAAVSEIAPDDETAVKLAELSLIVCCSDRVVTFESFSDVSSEYVDVVLNYLSGTFYSKYSADVQMMDKFSENYPELSVNALIPVSDYENTVYAYFGGNRKAAVKSTAMYSYLDRIDAFILVGQAQDIRATYTVHEAVETENTYRLTVSYFKNSDNMGTYDIIFRKREDGEPYIWRLTASSKLYGGL